MDSSQEICAICLRSIRAGQGQALFTAECSHVFHFNCIASNVQHGNKICPTCRATLQHIPFQVQPPPPPPPPTTYTSYQQPIRLVATERKKEGKKDICSIASSATLMDSSQEICAICLGSIRAGQGQALYTAECSHVFHFNCVASNVQHGNKLCPTRRATLKHLPFQLQPPPPPLTTYTSYQQPIHLVATDGFFDDEPLPSGSMPTSSSLGQTESMTVKALPEYPALIRTQKGDPFAVLVGIQAPPLSVEALDSRAPIDLVAVLDVSGSMNGEKMRLLKQAVNFVVNSLGPTDRLSIIIFSTTASRVTPFKRMTDQGKSETTQAVNSIRIDWATNIIAGLQMAVQVLDQRRQRNPVASIILLTDGQDTENGHAHAFRVALSRLPGCIRSREIENSPSESNAVPVHTFGFGNDHDATALHAISDVSGGTFSYIESIEIIQDAFAQCIGGLLSVVAQQVVINIQSGSPGVRIQTISSGRYRNVVDRDEGKVYVENLYAEEEKQFLVFLLVPEEEEDALITTRRLIEVTCSYKDTLSNENVVSETKIVEIRRPTSEGLSESDREVCLEVVRERNRVSVAQGIAEAQVMAERGELETARLILTHQSENLMSSASAQSGDPTSDLLLYEMSEIRERMSSKHHYKSSGRAYALSRTSAHMNQRANIQAVAQMAMPQATSMSSPAPPFPQAMGYQTPTMRMMVNKSRDLRHSNAKGNDDDDDEAKI